MKHCPLCGEAHDDMPSHLQSSHTPEELREAFEPMMQPQMQFQFTRANDFRKHYAIETHIEMTPLDFRIYAINEAQHAQAANVVTKIQESAFILAPLAAKGLYEGLGSFIQEFEENWGEIRAPEQA